MAIEYENSLCCCEYINIEGEKSHLLATCCNCEELDLYFTRCICGRPKLGNINKMLLTFQDRLRIPWRGGAKQVSFGALVPVFAIPFVISFAAINQIVTIIIFISCLAFLTYTYYYVKSQKLRTNFFLLWLLWSVAYLVLLFQFTVPLLEVLPEENLFLVLLTGCSILCLYCTYKRSVLNHVLYAHDEKEEKSIKEDDCTTALLIEPSVLDTKESLCKRCSRDTITAHCEICSSCILRQKHHSYWLNCCIGEWNYRYYLFGLLLAELSLLIGSNLTLTAICHPVLVRRFGAITIMLPDDCTEVYDDYKFSLAFVIAVYALVIAFSVLIELGRQVYVLLGAPFWNNYAQSMRQRKSFRAEGRSFSLYAK